MNMMCEADWIVELLPPDARERLIAPDEWEPILRAWLAECGTRKGLGPNEMSNECARYRRLRDVLARCLQKSPLP